MIPVEVFEAARPQLLAMAHRMLGSSHDAEDAVQTAWLHAYKTESTRLANVDAWLTTVTARVCLDQLRARSRRREAPLLADAIPAEQVAADEQLIQTDKVSRALMVLLDELTAAQRVAYVLHELFSIPFDQVAAVLGTTTVSAKKHASRARRRLESTQPGDTAANRDVVEAFLRAARSGNLSRMIELMHPDCVRVADPSLLPPHAPATMTGAPTVARETAHFLDRIRATTPMTVNGEPAYVIAPGGHRLATVHFHTEHDRVSRIVITRISPDDLLTAA